MRSLALQGFTKRATGSKHFNRVQVRSYMEPYKYEALKARAQEAGLSISSMVRLDVEEANQRDERVDRPCP